MTGSVLNSYISKGANVILDIFRMNTITLGSTLNQTLCFCAL